MLVLGLFLCLFSLSGCALVGAGNPPGDPPTKKHLSASPAIVGFGNVNVGSQASQAVTWTNTGNGNVTLSQVGVLGPGFSIGPFTVPRNLAPGQSARTSVVFAPTRAGSVMGSVTVMSDATNSPYTLTLSGTGVGSLRNFRPAPRA